MRIDDGGTAGAADRVANRVGGEISRLGCGADFVRIAAHREAHLKAVGMNRLELLEAAARNVGGVVQARDPMLGRRTIDLIAREVLARARESAPLRG